MSPTSASPRPTALRIRDVEVAPSVLLAPMEGVTDVVFRRLIRQIGGCGLTTTEFVPSKGLSRTKGLALSDETDRDAPARGDSRWARMVAFDADERPVSIQIFGRDPETMAEGARIVEALGADICDINMGCPSKKVCKNSGGSALMKEPELAAEIVRQVRAAISIPLTVKMRSGFDPDNKNAPELAWICQEEGAEAVTIHWRTRADLYGGERDVAPIAAAKARLRIPVIANGDVVDPASALRMLDETGCDGVMVGRGAMKNPWCLRQISDVLAGRPPTVASPLEKKRVILGFLEDQRPRYHTELGALGRFKAVAKHFFDGRSPEERAVRTAVLRSQSIDEAKEIAAAWFDARAAALAAK